ncbi:MAG: FxsA family protein [Acidimicrobiia bacterium]|nr:FxsA family protein [Acidimicrobiia bacterium]
MILALLVVVPLVELAVFVKVSEAIGILDTVGILILVSLVGVWVVKRQGLAIVARIRAELGAGRAPAATMVDGLLVLAAGLLLLFPGFVTDAAGLALLVPPVRSGTRRLLARRFERRVHVRSVVVARERHANPAASAPSHRPPTPPGPPPALPPG